jgi:uncharacterized protein YdaU (DUF1376 family)
MPDRTTLPWFPFYARDFASSRHVRRMPLEAVGLYILMLAEQWDGGPLPDDPEEVATLIGRPVEDVEKLWSTMSLVFEETEEGWVSPRLESVRTEQKAKHRRRVEAGKRGAQVRWGQGVNSNATGNANGNATGNANGNANAIAMRPQWQSEPEPEDYRAATELPGKAPTPNPSPQRGDGSGPGEEPSKPRATRVGRSRSGQQEQLGELEDEARAAIREHLLQGESAKVGSVTLTVEGELKRWRRMVGQGMDPEVLTGSIRHLRGILEGGLATQPVGLGLVVAKPQLLEQATAAYLKAGVPDRRKGGGKSG